MYQEKGPAALAKKQYVKANGAFKEKVVRDIGENPLPLHEKDMGRPKKKKPEEMTELERLRYENECLRTENALLKKVRALVEEREARLREIGRKPSKN